MQCLAIINHFLGYDVHFVQYGVETLLTVRVVAVFQTQILRDVYTLLWLGSVISADFGTGTGVSARALFVLFAVIDILEVQSADFRKFETQHS